MPMARVRWRSIWLASLAGLAAACAAKQPCPVTLGNDEKILTILDGLTSQYESFGLPKADVASCRHKTMAVRDEIKAERFDIAGQRLQEALDCTTELGTQVAAQLDALRDNHHLEMDLKELLGREVDFGQGLYKLVGIKWTPQGAAVRYDLEFRSVPGDLVLTRSFLLR
jgi:hypothetical protein